MIFNVVLTMPNEMTFEHPFSRTIESPLSPLEWYNLIKYSSGYIGKICIIVIALHYSVPFYAFDTYNIVKYKFFVNKKSSKIYDIVDRPGSQKKELILKEEDTKVLLLKWFLFK